MNNTQIDPVTGQPINNINQIRTQYPNQPVQPQTTVQMPAAQNIQPNLQNSNITIQQQMNSIPTVDQNAQQFMQNTQATTVVKKEDKKEGPNTIFIVILFAIIFAAIIFLFPYLLNIIG